MMSKWDKSILSHLQYKSDVIEGWILAPISYWVHTIMYTFCMCVYVVCEYNYVPVCVYV